jgi:hypothetical protein
MMWLAIIHTVAANPGFWVLPGAGLLILFSVYMVRVSPPRTPQPPHILHLQSVALTVYTCSITTQPQYVVRRHTFVYQDISLRSHEVYLSVS